MPAIGPATEAIFTTYNYPYEPPKPCQNINVRVNFFEGNKKIMNRTARMLSIPQELRFLIVFRSPLSEPVNAFGQFSLPIRQSI
jgi:hypothetical protein